MAENKQIEYGEDPVGFGVLNEVSKPLVKHRLDPKVNSYSRTLKDVAVSRFSDDVLKGLSVVKGRVLKIITPDDPPADSWFTGLFGSEKTGKIAALLQIKARIIEFHSHLPVPSDLNSADIEQQRIIDMYPTFIAQSESVSAEVPELDTFVLLGIGNLENMSDLVYLGKLNDGEGANAAGGGAANAGAAAAADAGGANAAGGGAANAGAAAPGGVAAFIPSNSISGIKVMPSPAPYQGGFRKRKFPVTLFTIHEDGVPTNTPSELQRRLSKFYLKNKTSSSGKPYYPGMHFWMDGAGTVYQSGPADGYQPHGKCQSAYGVGIEVMNASVAVDSKYVETYEKRGYIIIGPDSTVAHRRTERLRWASSGNYCLPQEHQCQVLWKLILSFIKQPEKWGKNIKIPAVFPYVGDMPHVRGHTVKKCFPWSRVPIASSGDQIATNYFNSNNVLHSGITSHVRTGHGDGSFLEYYCYCRSNGADSRKAFLASIGAAAAAAKTKYSLLPWNGPDDQYILDGIRLLGAKAIDTNPIILAKGMTKQNV